jgi:hypothetical protein
VDFPILKLGASANGTTPRFGHMSRTTRMVSRPLSKKQPPSAEMMEADRDRKIESFLESTRRLERLEPYIAAAQKRLCAATTYTKPSTRADFEEGHRRRKIALKRLDPLLEMEAKFKRTKMSAMKHAGILERRLNSVDSKIPKRVRG